MTFRPDGILSALEEHGVRFVLIGGLAATIHGSPAVTFDVDVVPEDSDDNLTRLSGALEDLDARIRVAGIDGGLVFDRAPALLGKMEVLNLETRCGDFDITFHPSAIDSFEEWDRGATDVEALGVHFRLAALADVIRSKEAADRPKDRLTLPTLRALAARQRRVAEDS
jgi:hypothetical protein